MALAFTLALLFREGFRILRKVAAENYRGRPEITDQIGAHVPRQNNRGHRKREQREEDVVLERLPATLTSKLFEKRKLFTPADFPAAKLLGFEFVQPHAPLKKHTQQDVINVIKSVYKESLDDVYTPTG